MREGTYSTESGTVLSNVFLSLLMLLLVSNNTFSGVGHIAVKKTNAQLPLNSWDLTNEHVAFSSVLHDL